jgi:hypothetical protein
MSYNIIDVDVREIDCWLTGRELRELLKEHGDDLPEINLFEDLDALGPTDDEKVEVADLSWSGVWSGNSYETFKTILRQLHGSARFSVTWEDGATDYFQLCDGSLEDVEIDW